MTTQTVVVMPRLSDSMEEGTVVRWLKADGELVAAGEDLVEIETDKATMAYQAEAAGMVRRLVAEGETLPLGAPIAELQPEGPEPHASPTGPAKPVASGGVEQRAQGNGRPTAPSRVAASPVARRLAAEAGIELGELAPGSGPRGRVVKRDVERARAAGTDGAGQAPAEALPPIAEPTAPIAPSSDAAGAAKGEVATAQLTRLQTTVVRRMAESHATVPEFSLEVEVDADALVALRGQLKVTLAGEPTPSFNDFVVKAAARALRLHPRVNGGYLDGHVERYGRVNVGVAVAAEDALVVPVVTDADIRSLGAIAAETRRLTESARTATLTPPEVAGGTFTVSNLGMYGVRRFTAVVNPPQAAILAVGALEQRPVVRDGQIVAGHVMSLTLCSDHRILYGADAAAFLADIRAGLEEPMRLLV